MTAPSGRPPVEPDDSSPSTPEIDGTEPADGPRSGPVGRPGATIFTIEGRAAPGLFVLGWLATIMGLAITLVAFQVNGDPALELLIFGLLLLTVGLVAGAGSQGLERQARHVPGYAGPSPFLVFGASIPLAVLLGIGVSFAASLMRISSDTPLASLLLLFATAGSYLALVRLLVVGTRSLSWADMGVRRPDGATVRAALTAVSLAIPIYAVTVILALTLSLLLPIPASPLPSSTDVVGRILNLVSAAIVAPVAEELFFRGFATTAWLRRLGPTSAIVRGALFFAFAHVLEVGGTSFGDAVERAAFAFVVRLPVALALGWVYIRFRSLLPSIALHATFNAVPLLLAN